MHIHVFMKESGLFLWTKPRKCMYRFSSKILEKTNIYLQSFLTEERKLKVFSVFSFMISSAFRWSSPHSWNTLVSVIWKLKENTYLIQNNTISSMFTALYTFQYLFWKWVFSRKNLTWKQKFWLHKIQKKMITTAIECAYKERSATSIKTFCDYLSPFLRRLRPSFQMNIV